MDKIYLINPPSDFLIDDKSNMPLGLLFLHAHLQNNDIEVEIIDLAGLKPEEWVIPDGGFIYGITATTPQFEAACKIAEKIKINGGIAILGGVHATCVPEDSLKYGKFDIVVVGEGETTMLELAQNKKALDEIPGLYYWSGGEIVSTGPRLFEKAIDTFSHPIIDSIDYKSYNCGVFTTADGDMVSGAQIITSRGCPGKCSFCCSPHIYRRKVRFHTTEYVENWVDYLNGYGYNTFYVVDDTVLLNSNRLRKMCDIFKSRESRWRACVRGDAVTLEKMEMLYDSGCRQVDIGVESGSQKVLDLVQKGERVEDNINAVNIAHSVGIKVKSCLIVGLPGEEQEDIDLTVDFIEKCAPDSVTLCTFIPFPGCDIFFNPDKYNYKVDHSKGYSKYVCCGADAMAESVAVKEENEKIVSFRRQLLNAIKDRSTNATLKNRNID